MMTQACSIPDFPLFSGTDEEKRLWLTTALEEYAEKGREGMSVEGVAKRRGQASAELFKNNDDLRVALFLEGLWDHQDRVLAVMESAATAEACVKGIIAMHTHWYETWPALGRYVVEGQPLPGDKGVRAARKERNKVFGLKVFQLFQKFVSTGALKALPPEMYHALLFAPVQEWSENYLRGKSKMSPAQAAKLFGEAAWNALNGAASDA